MIKKILLILFLTFLLPQNSFAERIRKIHTEVPPAEIEIWNSVDGLKRLEQSHFKNDFYQLANFYQAQINPLYCSVATGTMLLNALNYGDISSQEISEIHKPSGEVIEFKLYTQQGFLNDKTDEIKDRSVIELKEKTFEGNYDAGLSLGDFTQILRRVYRLEVETIYASENSKKSLEKFRYYLRTILLDKERFLVVNFDGKILGQKTGGHISAVAAYDEKTDSVLILDAALHKNQWYFASVEKLFAAMNSRDGDYFRGYLIASR